MKNKLVIVLSVILTLTLLLTSVAFAAGGKEKVALAQEAGQSWLDNTVALAGEPVEWLGAYLTTPQVCYDLKGKPNAYMFTIENDGEVVGYIIVGSSDYGYPMLEAADVPPPSVPGADEVKSTLERDLGLKAAEVGNSARLLYLGFDNLFAVYQAGQQEVAVNLVFDFAIPASNLKATMRSPEDYKAAKKATEEAKPEMIIPDGGAYKYLDMYAYCFSTCSGCNYQNKCWCGPSSGVSIGYYYKYKRGYSNLPYGCNLYCELYDCMGTILGYTDPPWLGPGFIEMTENHGYYNFSYVYDTVVTGGDYWNRVTDINNNWPIMLSCLNIFYLENPDTDVPHTVVIRGYQYPYAHPTRGTIQHAIVCTDSWRGSRNVWLDWDNLGVWPITTTIKDA